jgi:hypothetical protein
MEVLFGAAGGLLQCFLFAGVAALVIALIVWSSIRARQRRDAAARLAAEWGFEFYPDDPYGMASRYAQFDLFENGHSQQASNVLCGRIDGREVILCDYQYTTGSGKNKSTHCYQAALLMMPILGARLQMRPENFLDRMASWVGHDDINFESEEFSRRYHIKCDDRKFAYDLFHARLIEYLLACGEAPSLETNGPLLLLYDTQGEVEALRRLRAIGEEIIRSIPDYVRTARGIEHKTGGPA